jgi:hypothetical protein
MRLLRYSAATNSKRGKAMTKNASIAGTGTRWPLGAVLLSALLASVSPALAFSEIQREDVAPSADGEAPRSDIEREDLPPPAAPGKEEEPASPPATGPAPGVPLPDPIVIPQDEGATGSEEPAAGDTNDIPVPQIHYDVELLPEPVQRMRSLIMEACLTGDIEKLRPLISVGDNATQLSFGVVEGDPVDFLRNLSGDDQGQEILAILYEIMAAGYVVLDRGEPSEVYVWPYFFAVPLDSLDSRQRVELFKIVTAGDYQDMKNFGAYIFYRVGISPEGKWVFFVAGD